MQVVDRTVPAPHAFPGKDPCPTPGKLTGLRLTHQPNSPRLAQEWGFSLENPMPLWMRFLIWFIMPTLASIGLGCLCAIGLHLLGAPGWLVTIAGGGVTGGAFYSAYALLDQLTIK